MIFQHRSLLNFTWAVHILSISLLSMEIMYRDLERAYSPSAKPKFSFGAEYMPLKWLPVRAGFGFGGDENLISQLAQDLSSQVSNSAGG